MTANLPKLLRLAAPGLLLGIPVFGLLLFNLSPFAIVVVFGLGGAALGLSFLSTLVYLGAALRHSGHTEASNGEK